jgi:endonuclease III
MAMTEAELEQRQARWKVISKTLTKIFPDAKIALTFKNNWELLVAVRLSAQCTDKKVNEISPALFKKYPKLDDYVNADVREFEKMIYQTGFFRSKSKDILAAAKYIKETYKGKLPKTMAEMIKVPGVGRKSANVILGNAYGVVEGIAIDTHMIRLSRLLGLTTEKTPEKIERDLMKIIPEKDWFVSTYRLIDYGRKYCPARPHKHEECPLTIALGKFEKGK